MIVKITLHVLVVEWLMNYNVPFSVRDYVFFFYKPFLYLYFLSPFLVYFLSPFLKFVFLPVNLDSICFLHSLCLYFKVTSVGNRTTARKALSSDSKWQVSSMGLVISTYEMLKIDQEANSDFLVLCYWSGHPQRGANIQLDITPQFPGVSLPWYTNKTLSFTGMTWREGV